MDLTVRPIQTADAAAAAQLSGQLGYPVDAAVMRRRIEMLGPGRYAVLVACLNGSVVGWIDVREVHHLQTGCGAEIGGLVVSEECRSQGVGARLVASAEEWARDRGLNRMTVRSRATREAAHRFYLREGYAVTKTSVVFTKEIRPAIECNRMTQE